MRMTNIAAAWVTVCFCLVAPAQAQLRIDWAGAAAQTAQGGVGARSAAVASGGRASIVARRAIVSDGQGDAVGASGSAFATSSGVHGIRTRSFERASDGSASGERSTRITNASTGVTVDGTSSYTKGSGASRSVSCTDAAGNAVACGPR